MQGGHTEGDVQRKERPQLDGRAESTVGDRLGEAGMSWALSASGRQGVGSGKGQKSLEDVTGVGGPL